jgi:methyl-accepting chemotaxis protein
MVLNNLPIPRKLAGAFFVLICMFGVIGGLLYGNLAEISRASEDKEAAMTVTRLADEIMTQVLEQQGAVRAFALLGRPEFLRTYDDSKAKLKVKADAFLQKTRVAGQKERLNRLMDEVEKLGEKLDRVIALSRSPATRGEAQRLAGVKQLGQIRVIMAEITQVQADRIAETSRIESEARSAALLALWAGGSLTVAFAILMGWLLSRGIASPISQMTSTMKQLAGGDNSVTIPGNGRGDEIGDMAAAVSVFLDAAIAKKAADEAKSVADAEQKLVVETLTQNLARLSKGDLTGNITGAFAPAYEAVKTNFNEAIANLRTLIGAVNESTATISTGAVEIASASEDLARRTESNAASLEQTSAAIVQIDDRLKATASAATRTVSRADGAIAVVTSGRVIAEEAVGAMGRVSESAKGIDSVIEGLDKIAFQTRVLAMNAAVEAGRAGDAGRGFAVVADLVSALAMRAEEEAKRARDQLTVTQSDIVTAVGAVRKVDGAFGEILGDVEEVHKLLSSMAMDNQAQSSAITQISVAVGTMDHATQQNAAMVEETSAAARNLANEVSSLTAQAAVFKNDASVNRYGRNQEAINGLWSLQSARSPHRPDSGNRAVTMADRIS